LRGVSKDRPQALVAHPSRLAVKNGEHLRVTSRCGKESLCRNTDLRLARYFGLSEGFFLGLQMDYDLMQRRREIDRDLKTIRPRAA
jgi:hypothetical protein